MKIFSPRRWGMFEEAACVCSEASICVYCTNLLYTQRTLNADISLVKLLFFHNFLVVSIRGLRKTLAVEKFMRHIVGGSVVGRLRFFRIKFISEKFIYIRLTLTLTLSAFTRYFALYNDFYLEQLCLASRFNFVYFRLKFIRRLKTQDDRYTHLSFLSMDVH